MMAKELIEEIKAQAIDSSQSTDLYLEPIQTLRGGKGIQGTYACKELVYAYAMWISAKFHLHVIRAFDAMVTGRMATEAQPTVPQTLSEALRLAAELAEEREKLKPKAEAYERIAVSDGGMCITNAAKDLQIRPKDLFAWLRANRWIYRRPGGSGWVAYQDKLQAGFLEHKVITVTRSDGTEKTVEQVLVTPKGLAKLAEKLAANQAA